MDRREYEYLQERFSKLLAKEPYNGGNKIEAYRCGILACKSALKDVFYHNQETKVQNDEA